MKKKISREAEEMYAIYLDAGVFDDPQGDFKGMTGDWHEDMYNFASQWKEMKKKIKQIKVNING